jgi:hypothetical protein
MASAAATNRKAIPYLQIKGGLRQKRGSESDILRSSLNVAPPGASKILTSEIVPAEVELVQGGQSSGLAARVSGSTGSAALFHSWTRGFVV